MKTRSTFVVLTAAGMAAVLWLVLGAVSSSPALAAVRRDEAFIYLRGLIALAFVNPADPAKGVTAHLLSPGDTHPPALSILASQLSDDIDPAKFKPDRLVPLGNGDALAIWDIESVKISPSNLTDTDYYEDPTDVTDEATQYDAHRARWAPTMKSVFKGADQTIKSGFQAKATATLHVGRLEAVFDPAGASGMAHHRERWDVNERKCTAVADGFRLGLDLVDDGGTFTLLVDTAKMKGQEIMIRAYGSATLSALPIMKSASMEHFKHFYDMREKVLGEPTPTPPTLCKGIPPPGPSFNGSRCAPTKFP